MAHYDFKKDLSDAKRFEDEVELLFIEEGHKVERCNNGDYDLLVEYKEGNTLRWELKDDLMAERTGNLAIEFESRGKASGINRTKSDYYLIRAGKKLYTLPTPFIRKMIAEKKYFRIVNGGDSGSNTMMYLFKIDTILEGLKQ